MKSPANFDVAMMTVNFDVAMMTVNFDAAMTTVVLTLSAIVGSLLLVILELVLPLTAFEVAV